MKITLSTLSLFILLACFTSCKKDAAVTLTNAQLLTQHVWQIKNIIYQNGNNQVYYYRGGANTTGQNYSVATYTYNANGTGTYYDPAGNSWSFTWAFNSTDPTQLTFVLNYATPVTISFSSIVLTSNSFYYAQTFDDAGVYDLGSTQLIPVP